MWKHTAGVVLEILSTGKATLETMARCQRLCK